jgi:hypothetical protein
MVSLRKGAVRNGRLNGVTSKRLRFRKYQIIWYYDASGFMNLSFARSCS